MLAYEYEYVSDSSLRINKYTVCFCLKILENNINYSNFLEDKSIYKVLVKYSNRKTYFIFDVNLKTLIFYIVMERPFKILKKKINYRIFLKLINSKGTNKITANIVTESKSYHIKSDVYSNNIFDSILNFIDSHCSSHYSTPIWHLHLLLHKIKQYNLSFECSIN